MRPFLIYSCLVATAFVSGCVAPDQYKMLENRVAAIERESNRQAAAQEGKKDHIEQLKADMDTRSKADRENYAEIKYEIQQVKEGFHRIQGQMEELQHQFGASERTRQEDIEKRLDRLDNTISKNYEKIIALEAYMGFEPTETTPAEDKLPPSPDVPTGTEDGLYTHAKSLFDQGDKDGARIQFENFINRYPDSTKADNARFWIADSYYAEKWYEKAILEYQKVLETYPDSNKAAAARLKQGYAFAALGEKANARLILKELIKRHPDSKEAQYAKEKLKGLN